MQHCLLFCALTEETERKKIRISLNMLCVWLGMHFGYLRGFWNHRPTKRNFARVLLVNVHKITG